MVGLDDHTPAHHALSQVAAARTGPRFGPGWQRWPGHPRHSWIQQIGDGTPFSIRAEWSKARHRGHSGLTQRTSAVYAIWWWRWWCIMISGGRTEQLDIIAGFLPCHWLNFTSDFLSFILVEHIRKQYIEYISVLHGAFQLTVIKHRCLWPSNGIIGTTQTRHSSRGREDLQWWQQGSR